MVRESGGGGVVVVAVDAVGNSRLLSTIEGLYVSFVTPEWRWYFEGNLHLVTS